MGVKLRENNKITLAGWLAIGTLLLSTLSSIGSGVAWILAIYIPSQREIHLEDTRRIIEERIEQSDRKIVEVVSTMNGLLRAHMESKDYPEWIKQVYEGPDGRPEFRMTYLNSAYTSVFGKTLQEYQGKTDFEVWPHDIAQAFYEHDLQVYLTKRPHRFLEKTPMPGESEPKLWEFEKFYMKDEDHEGISGSFRPPFEEWSEILSSDEDPD